MHMSVCQLMCMCTMSVQYLRKPEEGTGSSETVVTDDYESLCGYWESNTGLLGKKPVISKLLSYYLSNPIEQSS